MTGTVPDFLQDEFTQEAWDSLTDAEREGMLGDESEEEQQQGEEEQQQQVEADAQREADAIAKATADQQPTQEEQQEAAPATEEQVLPTSPRPRGVIDATLPEDYDQRVAANEKAMDDLEQSYNDGDISTTEFMKEQRRLNNENINLVLLKERANLAIESSEQALMNHWQGLIQPFLAKHPELGEDEVSMSGFDSYLKQTTAPVMQAGGTPGQAEIDKAYGLWCKRFNFTPAGEQQQQAPAGKKPITAPPTLGGLPVSNGNSVEDGRWAALDRLEGVAFEEALAKLSQAELDEYSKRA